jgi:hypothetical protein
MPLAGKIFLSVLAVVEICVLVRYPLIGAAILAWVLAPLGMLVGAALVLERTRVQRRKLISQSRAGESICQFARSFDRRRTDTWVLRAVYEELQHEMTWVDPAFPIHAADSIADELLIDPDDLSMDIVQTIAKRSRRSLEHFERNPFYPGIVTVRDLVSFFEHQPRVEGAS